MKDLLNAVEPALSYAREQLRRMEDAGDAPPVPESRAAYEAVRSARAFLDLHRPPVYREYEPDRVLASQVRAAPEREVVRLDPVDSCVGDPDQVRLAVELVVRNVVLEADAVLIVELFQEEDVPRLSVELDGPGRFADPLSFDGFQALPLEDLRTRWTAITRGGRIDKTVNGLVFRLKGVRVVPESAQGLDDFLGALRTAEDRLRLLVKAARAAEEGGPPPSDWKAVAVAAREDVETALAAVESGMRGAEPASLGALVEESAAEARAALESQGIALEIWCDRNVPPIVMIRERMAGGLRSLFHWAGAVVPAGGSVSVLVDYDDAGRAAALVATFDGLTAPATEGAYLASLRRTVEEAHGGTLEFESTERNATLTLTLPDPVGKRLDEAIPHWDRFSERSRQYLRLLKSGGPGLPEEVLLEGILEDELERWLLPRLEAAPAVNLAHELPPTNEGLEGSSPERLAKALDQIRRRKVKKEVVRPSYAAEILWAYRADERSRRAVGADRLDEDAIRTLCRGLLRKPPAYVDCLRAIAEALDDSHREQGSNPSR